MKKIVIMGLLAIYTMGCTAPEIQESDEYGTKKSESVNSEEDSKDYELDNSED